MEFSSKVYVLKRKPDLEGKLIACALPLKGVNFAAALSKKFFFLNCSACSNPTFDRPSEKMYHYAEGEAIDCVICIEHVEENHAQVRLSCGHIYHLNCLG